MAMKKLTITIIILFSSLYSLFSQEIREGYFMDSYVYGYRLNPAFQTEKNFIGGILSISGGTQSNVGLSTFFYPHEGELVTFMHPSVSQEEFLSKIRDKNKINFNLKENILSYGFWKKFRGREFFNTLELNYINSTAARIPKGLFEFLKADAPEDFSYDLSNVKAFTNTYFELAYGSSLKMGKLSLGARAKFLVGMNAIRLNVSSMYAFLAADEWAMYSNAEFYAAGGGVKRRMKEAPVGGYDVCDLSYVKFRPFGFGGLGLGVDLGIKYEFNEYINVSAAIKDLGFIWWFNKACGESKDYKWIFSGEIIEEIEDFSNIKDVVNLLVDNVKSIYEFEPKKRCVKGKPLTYTANIGAEFKMPFYEKMSIGILGTQIYNHIVPFHEVRMSLNARPLDWLGLTVSTAYSTYGWEYGGMVNFYAKKFSVFLGTDNYYTHMTPQFVPVNQFNTHVALGFTYNFGGRKNLN